MNLAQHASLINLGLTFGFAFTALAFLFGSEIATFFSRLGRSAWTFCFPPAADVADLHCERMDLVMVPRSRWEAMQRAEKMSVETISNLMERCRTASAAYRKDLSEARARIKQLEKNYAECESQRIRLRSQNSAYDDRLRSAEGRLVNAFVALVPQSPPQKVDANLDRAQAFFTLYPGIWGAQ